MKTGKPTPGQPGFVQNVRAQPWLFVGSALGLLAAAVLKGGLGRKRNPKQE